MKKIFVSIFALLLPSYALAGDITEWLSVDTYMRARTLSSLNGGESGALGNSTLLGRLMNESTKLQIDAEARTGARLRPCSLYGTDRADLPRDTIRYPGASCR